MHTLWSLALGVIPVAVTALTADLARGQTRLPEVTVTAPGEWSAAASSFRPTREKPEHPARLQLAHEPMDGRRVRVGLMPR